MVGNKVINWLVFVGVVLLALVFLAFSENKQAIKPTDSLEAVVATAKQETKEIITELGYGDDEAFPEVYFIPEENWVGNEKREVKKILIERKVIPEHDYYNVFNNDVLNSRAGEDMSSVKFEFREGEISDSTGELEIWVKWYWTTDGKPDSGGSIVADSNKLSYVQEVIPMWRPGCYGGCKLSEEFLEKYPEAK